jgi:NAD(P)-dependent dehydrogenase (short-subunit alcohol dehydrogenase family)
MLGTNQTINIETNFLSGVRLSRHYLPRMKTAGWGRIIFISRNDPLQKPAEATSEVVHCLPTRETTQ